MKKLVLTLVLTLLLFSCKERGFKIDILFDSLDVELKKETLILWKGVPVGKVYDVAVSNEGALVSARIAENYSNKIVSASLFYRNSSGEIEYHVLDPDSDPVKEGTAMKGTDKRVELLRLKAEHYLDNMADDARKFSSKELEDILDTLEDAVGKGADSLKEEVLPALKKYLEELKKGLEDINRPEKEQEGELI